MKKILSAALLLASMSINAQETYTNAELATQDLNGDARYVGMGGALNALGADCVLREGVKKAGPVITDNGNVILDCQWKEPINVAEMEDKINGIVGVVENGLFSKNKPIVFLAKDDGTVEQRNWH